MSYCHMNEQIQIELSKKIHLRKLQRRKTFMPRLGTSLSKVIFFANWKKPTSIDAMLIPSLLTTQNTQNLFTKNLIREEKTFCPPVFLNCACDLLNRINWPSKIVTSSHTLTKWIFFLSLYLLLSLQQIKLARWKKKKKCSNQQSVIWIDLCASTTKEVRLGCG